MTGRVECVSLMVCVTDGCGRAERLLRPNVRTATSRAAGEPTGDDAQGVYPRWWRTETSFSEPGS